MTHREVRSNLARAAALVLAAAVLVVTPGVSAATTHPRETHDLDEEARATLLRVACNEHTAGKPVAQALVERVGLHTARLTSAPDGAREATPVGLLDAFRGERCPEPQREIDYRADALGDVEGDVTEFRRLVRGALADPRGWSLDGDLAFVSDEDDAQFTVWLASPEEVAAANEVCSPDYSCRVGDDIYINDVRWRDPPDTFAGEELDDYRRYVVNHEVGHWLGHGHFDCAEEGEAAPVMQQQSIDLEGCEANVWPLEWERDPVRDDWLP